ncbi:MAG: hypothetical protein HZA91_04710 [Verrucomicrobia bacterium]|nr:hypothetical protein [Verrucomicrobiota bacterium]
MKRSKSIRLVLIGGLSAGAVTSCGPDGGQRGSASASNVYTNNHYVSGLGYYHAPFRGWYSLPYNHYDPQRQGYFQGGQWAAAPHLSITNLSEPMMTPGQTAPYSRTGVARSGFGSSSRSFSSIHS